MRAMLDAHPEVAIPYETHIWSRLTQSLSPTVSYRPTEIITLLKSAPQWSDFNIDEEAMKREISALKHCSVAEVTRRFYHRYAFRLGKLRGGDKTPQNLKFMSQIQNFLPEAHFIHIIRDGRAVAASLKDLWFGPGKDMSEQATTWEQMIRDGREQSTTVNNYLEIRYEQLLSHPEETLKLICDFLELSYSEKMLSYDTQSLERLKEIGNWDTPEGLVTGDAIRSIHSRVSQAPDLSRIDAWKSILNADEINKFQQQSKSLLLELGYSLI